MIASNEGIDISEFDWSVNGVRYPSQRRLTKYMNNTAADPPNIQLTIRASPIKRFGRLDGGGWGYVRGGMAGAAGTGWRGPLSDTCPE